jgi:hypothetical protein
MKAIVRDAYGSVDVLRLGEIDPRLRARVRYWCAYMRQASTRAFGT